MLCKVDGCTETPDNSFGLALIPDGGQGEPASAEGKICLTHANALWSLLGPPPVRATRVMAEELCNEINNGADAVVIRMDKKLAGL